MSMKDELRRILTIISDLTHNDTNSSVKDTEIIVEANRQSDEIEKYLNELQPLGLIKEDSNPRLADVNYGMYRITREGINEIYNKEFR
ncbi:MAG TPA: winged helix-turn-helix domain-containing protein [Nitrososphaeraceae archaeon]